MAKTYYEMLEVPADASVEDIKRSFRREIAKYHPDKVQHLGREFQEIAAIKAAELTQAYKTLTDETLRAEYDGQLSEGFTPPTPYAQPASPPSAPPADAPPRPQAARPAAERAPEPDAEPQPSGKGSFFQVERAGASDLVRRATVMRFRHALEAEFGRYEDAALQGFEVTCIPKPPFWKLKLPPRILGRFVPQVDAAALVETWAMAAKMKKDTQRDLCVFLMGPVVAPAGALAQAINEQRKRPMPAGGTLVMIPVNTNTWAAHVPQDAPAVVKSLLTRLKSAV
jgi:curved DNA-binding protein CbpA